MPNHRSTVQHFIDKARLVHGDKYDYSQCGYTRIRDRIWIVCPQHGGFLQIASSHIQGHGCRKCADEKANESRVYNVTSLNEFVVLANKIHGFKYDYSKVDYISKSKKVIIICPLHGEFTQQVRKHLVGQECPRCRYDTIRAKRKTTTEEYVKKATETHGDRYDYSRVVYIAAKKYVEIICKTHGVFKQQAGSHISGKGCSRCSLSRGEEKIAHFLDCSGIQYEVQKKFDGCKNGGYFYKFDFYIHKHGSIIEYHGGQHFQSVSYFGGEKTFTRLVQNDLYKKNWAIKNGFTFIEYTCNQTWDFIEVDLHGRIKEWLDYKKP